ncbi:uncharacterized protein LOC116935302 [Daphnia magna]|uniref:uncharacterized protein LOC116935302 n=1 Tax=Daphnia magna TaxID=35525 RepID=UPI001E1BA4D7|nr:uncharacterized protein LOC116935302 [Daphnia magna]
MRTKYNVSNSALDFLTQELQEWLKGREESLEGGEDGPPAKRQKLEFDSSDFVNSLLQLNTQKKRTHYYKSNFNLIEPEELFINSNLKTRMTNGSIGIQTKNNTFQYMSIKKRLTALFSNDGFRRLYFSESRSQDDFVRGTKDSKYVQVHPLFSKTPTAIRIQLFYDEVEVTNPLRSKTKKHELAMFCFRILNLPNSENSKLANIFPLAIVNSIHVKNNSFDFVFSEFLNELKELESEDGMLLGIPDFTNFRIRGTIAGVCADTKGAHEIGGFLGPSANRFCRLCLITREEIKQKSCFDQLEMRTRENYDEAVEASSSNPEKASDTGIRSCCVLNCSKYFHFGENLILDAMHDFLEGVVPFMIKLFLRQLYSCGTTKISAAELNRRIVLFHFSFYDLSNKPSPKFTDAGIRKEGDYLTKQRASQNWCLIRMFPLLVGDLIKEDNEYYIHFLQLLDILDILFSPKIALEQIVVLEDLIRQFVERFRELYPSVQPINKFHHMVHYPEVIRMHGPPTNYWCMRFEAFHNIVKKLAMTNCNFINFAKSAAFHVQSIFCANL